MKIAIALLLASVGCQTEMGLSNHPDGTVGPSRGPGSRPDAMIADAGNTNDSSKDMPPGRLPDLPANLSETYSLIDSTPSSIPDAPVADVIPDLQPDLSRSDLSPDLTVSTQPDTKSDLAGPDLTANLPLGTTCSRNSDCHSTFCTDGVCCEVAKCVDTCVPGGGSTCTPYNGFTCAPYGTCRGY